MLKQWIAALMVGLAGVSVVLSPGLRAGSKEPAHTQGHASRLVFAGQALLTAPAKGRTVKARYEYLVDADSFQAHFSIAPITGSKFQTYRYDPPVGDDLFESVYAVHFADLGNLICVQSTAGASHVRLKIYRLSESGRIEVVFDEASRFGFQIVDVTGDELPEICDCDGDIGPSKKTLQVFGWNGKAFAFIKKISVDTPHVYAICRKAAADPASVKITDKP